jgi:hypothetical protein
LFEISFLRLPTEEGHLLPAFISFLLIIKDFNGPKISILLVLSFLIISGFYDLKFYRVNQLDSASEVTFEIYFDKGFLFQEYELRKDISDKTFHYFNSRDTLKNAWENGCPN